MNTTGDYELVDRRWKETLDRAALLLEAMSEIRLGYSEQDAAKQLGLDGRDALRAWLRHQRLPPFRIFRDWYYIVRLVELSDVPISLTAWALRRGHAPGAYSRFVKHVTGRTWMELRLLSVQTVRAHALSVWYPYDHPL